MGFISDIFGGGGGAARSAVRTLEAVELPELQKLALERLSVVGDPRDFIERLQDTELQEVKTDPTLQEAQRKALAQVQDIADRGGLSEGDEARLRQIQREEAIRERGQRQAITQAAQSRGVAGSGLELAQQLASQQGAAERSSQRDLGVAQQAQDRALQSILQSGQLAGQIRGQEFGEQARAAEAQDIINRFNVAARSQAGIQALGERQRVADVNVETANRERALEQQRRQQEFENRLRRAQSISGARLGQSAAQDRGVQAGTGIVKDIASGVTGLF